MLRKHGFMAKPERQPMRNGALAHVYLPNDLAATYAERRPRKRMVAMIAWIGFQIVVIALSLPSASDTVIGYRGLTQSSIGWLLWVLPAVSGLGAPIALYVLLHYEAQFRAPIIFAGLLCTLAAWLRLIPAVVS